MGCYQSRNVCLSFRTSDITTIPSPFIIIFQHAFLFWWLLVASYLTYSVIFTSSTNFQFWFTNHHSSWLNTADSFNLSLFRDYQKIEVNIVTHFMKIRRLIDSALIVYIFVYIQSRLRSSCTRSVLCSTDKGKWI